MVYMSKVVISSKFVLIYLSHLEMYNDHNLSVRYPVYRGLLFQFVNSKQLYDGIV